MWNMYSNVTVLIDGRKWKKKKLSESFLGTAEDIVFSNCIFRFHLNHQINQ